MATLVKVYLNETAGTAFPAVFLRLATFCLTGCVYVLWRTPVVPRRGGS